MTTLDVADAVDDDGPILKAATGIDGLDEITSGGLPAGRPTLICGTAGCGKTLLSLEFLVRGATEFGEPGVFVAFEETSRELKKNARSLGFDLGQLEREGKLYVDYVYVERSEIEATGEYDLEGLFLRIAHAVDSIGAKRVVLDTLEALFSALPDEFTLRSELRRLFRWLKDRGLTAVITAERGDGALTRNGLEEYVSDCVILLDHRVTDQVSTRRMRIVKYRGTRHGTNEYPFLIDDRGFSVLPITSVGLDHDVSDEKVSSGVPDLDAMLAGGYYRGSSILVSGKAGTGKSSLSAHFVNAACSRGERALVFAFEESQAQILRNMRSIGIHLAPWVQQGLLRFHTVRPTAYGLEVHVATMFKLVREFQPDVVVMDPVTNLSAVGADHEVTAALTRLIDMLKAKGITGMFTSLAQSETSEAQVSSVIDSWLLLRELELMGERNRALYVLKSRGMAHSHQVREFRLTERGVQLVDVAVGPDGVLTGSARAAHAARQRLEREAREQELALRERQLTQKRRSLEAQIAAMQAELASESEEIARRRQEILGAAERASSEFEELARAREGGARHGGAS
jgi:circadian clock protein KaiC